MISIGEAQHIILERTAPLTTEHVHLLQGVGRVVAEDQVAPWDIPPADNSAMDGYAFAFAAWNGGPLRVAGFLPAGGHRTLPVGPGETVKIMTGAPLPPGCDTVVPVEETETDGELVRLAGKVKGGSHVRPRGEDLCRGSVAVAAGAVLRPQEIGILSAAGKTAVKVFRRPQVAILSTGDELLEPGSPLSPGRIINSNSYSLAAQVIEAEGVPLMLGIAPDSREATMEKIAAGLHADLLITTGGVSVGDRDFVKESIEALGGTLLFHKVAMKPGKPVAFAVIGGKPVVALPGNPVAAMVAFEQFVRPALLKMAGRRRLFRPRVRAAIEEEVENRGMRPHLVRGLVTLADGRYLVTTTGNQSSARLSSLTRGNALVLLHPGACLAAGAEVEVQLLDREFETGGAPF
ncbi:MAG TPA: gephyrin-like molybdotransferase Glp [Geobacteraceae bacterium]